MQSKLWENDEMTEEEAEEVMKKAELLKIKMVRRTHARTHAREPRG